MASAPNDFIGVGLGQFQKLLVNKLHWVLDASLGEDQSRARQGYAAENLATLRRLALNLLKQEKTKKRGVRGKKLNASWNHPYLLKLLGLPAKEI